MNGPYRLHVETFNDEDLDFALTGECKNCNNHKQATTIVTYYSNNMANSPYTHVCDDCVPDAVRNTLFRIKQMNELSRCLQ